MADDSPQTLVGISFGDTFRAQEFLSAAQRLAANGRMHLKDAVFVIKRDDGTTHVRETIDPSPGRSALSGAVWASLFGLLLGGPVGWLAGGAIGAAGGAAAAKLVDLGVPDEWVQWFRRRGAAGHVDARAARDRSRPRRPRDRARAVQRGQARLCEPRALLGRPHPRSARRGRVERGDASGVDELP